MPPTLVALLWLAFGFHLPPGPEVFRKIVAGNEWAAFGFISAERELSLFRR